MTRTIPKKGDAARRKTGGVNLPGIERDAVILAALLTVGSLLFGSARVTAGVALGGILALFNWVWLKRFIRGVFLGGEGRVSKVGAALYALKYLLTFAVVWVVFKYDLINVFALLAGLLVVIMAITLEGVRKTRDLNKEDAPDGDAP